MGISQDFDLDPSWEQAAELLDATFPLADGSHRTAACYLVHFGHLLVITAEGACTGLVRPSQFVEAEGDEGAPHSILLEHEGLQVEIEPGPCRPAVAGTDRGHRLQRISELSAA